jgi:hypothetical protein
VFVGGATDPTYVHWDLIARSSAFFDNALNGSFKEKDGKVKLPDHKMSDFLVYIEWLYCERIGILCKMVAKPIAR